LSDLESAELATHGRGDPAPRAEEEFEWESPTDSERVLESELRSGANTSNRLIVAITGDFNERCSSPEFKQSADFLKSLYGRSVRGHVISPRDIFMVPGNHDLKYGEHEVSDRWYQYCLFYTDHANACGEQHGRSAGHLDPRQPQSLTRIIDQAEEGLLVAEINSSAYVQKDTPEEHRGQVDQPAIDRLRKSLEEIDRKRRHLAIKIALIHHHPVVLPVLAEPGRGYDAVLNADLLLHLLKKFGFHVVLHGHKHNPHTFIYDATSAWTTSSVHPLLIVAGGSAGSDELPHRYARAMNTYNVISIKWHPAARQARIRTETRGLQKYDDDNHPMPMPEWYWKTLRVDDRLIKASTATRGSRGEMRRRTSSDERFEEARLRYAADCRRNHPAIEIFPSLDSEQGYEARVWIEGRVGEGYEQPRRVEWASNPKYFPMVHVRRSEEDPQFGARFAYWGPTLIQARMFWGDGHEACAYIFARYPSGTEV
jgi:3',5'-cyclic AMP phosphodiesterase CpdA